MNWKKKNKIEALKLHLQHAQNQLAHWKRQEVAARESIACSAGVVAQYRRKRLHEICDLIPLWEKKVIEYTQRLRETGYIPVVS